MDTKGFSSQARLGKNGLSSLSSDSTLATMLRCRLVLFWCKIKSQKDTNLSGFLWDGHVPLAMGGAAAAVQGPVGTPTTLLTANLHYTTDKQLSYTTKQ